MATENKLPTNDPDLILAQTMGVALELGSSFKEINDSLIDQLMVYKEREMSAITHSNIDRDLIWQHIETRTTKTTGRRPILQIFTHSTTYAWASAAVLLIAAFIGFYWLDSKPHLTLVASSTTEILVITLDDGSLVTLRPHSELYRTNKETDERKYRLDGEAFFSVVTDPNNPFSVSGTEGTVTVLGTKFNLSTWGEKTAVYLEEGSISFSSMLNGEQIILSPGQSFEIQHGKIDLLTKARADQFTDWISNTIVFDNNTPNEVIQEIGHHFDVSIDIEQLNNHAGIDGTLQLHSISETLDDLGLVLGGSFQKISNNKFIFISME